MARIVKLESRWVCIATNRQIDLAASISSMLHEQGEYLPFFEFPDVETPYSHSRDLNKDGYFANLIGERAAYKINNALARIQPRSILLLGLTPSERTYLAALLPERKLLDINSLDDFTSKFPEIVGRRHPIECTPSQIIAGLSPAQSSGKRLIVNDSAPVLPAGRVEGAEGIVILENTNSIDDIASINYAATVGADVLLLPGVDRREIRELARELYVWSKDRSHPAFRTLKRRVSKNLQNIDFSRYRYATFFTVGVPYGLALENKIPSTHVLKDVDCGVFLANNLIEETDPLLYDSALLFSPQLFGSDETSEIEKLLTNDNYVVRGILGRQATVRNLSDHVMFYPFDILHICSHGGETDGYFVTQEYSDRKGGKHTVEFYEIVGFSPTKPQMVKVSRKIIFKTFDGFPWGSEELGSKAHYIFEDMLKALKFEREVGVKRIRADYPIALSCHIQCSDSIHQGDFDSLAGFGHPIVFNNSCSSSHELAANFIHAGARSYIATLWSVGNETAQKAAKVFYEELSKEQNVLTAFFRMQKSVSNARYQNVYVFWGLHVSSYRKPAHKSNLKVQGALANTFFLLRNSESTSSNANTKEHRSSAIGFLWHEMMSNAFGGRSFKPADIKPWTEVDNERHGSISQDDFSCGVNEIELETETELRLGDPPTEN